MLTGENMPTNIEIGIKVNDGGSTSKITKDGEKLKNVLKEASDIAANIRLPLATGAARQGVYASQPKMAASQPSSSGGGSSSDTNLARGIGGATGAEGRDFAKQAQGLGGLVHVYATFAANLFAVSAAFTALKNAADTSNLVKGLDQLGAASGTNLGSLSKKIVEATDGAVSLREAMTATAQASSAGMSTKNIERMAQAAKVTSQALGIGMSDALSRLSRGITKIEPELLDELGIMVKVDKASQDYARSLGKAASQLTDFEKRQGFANAVLSEAEQKFGAINLAANPYAKLSASLANLAQSGLAVINKFATPFLVFLSSNPIALATAIGYITSMLLKQAIPALTQWRNGLDDMAKNAAKNAAHIQKSFEEFQVEKGLRPGFALEKEAELHRAAASEIIKNNKLFKASSDIAMQASSQDGAFSAKNLGAVKSALTSTTKEIAAYTKELKLSTDPKEQADISAKIAGLNKTRDTYTTLGDTISKSMKAAKESVESLSAAETDLDKKARYLSEYAQRERIMKTAQQKASSTGVLSQVGRNTEFMGTADAFKQMWKDVTTGVTSETGEKLTKPLEGIRKYATAASGSLRILASAGMTLVSSLGTIGMVVGILGGAFAMLSAVFSKNEKEMAAFGSALDNVKSNGENVARVLELISKQEPLKQMSISSTSAVANAFNGLSDSLSGLENTSKKALDSLNTSNFDMFTNWVSKAWGGDISSKAADRMTAGLIDSISLLDEGVLKDAYLSKLAGILNVELVTDTSIKSAVKAISKLDPSVAALKFKELGKEVGNTNRVLNNSATDLNTFKTRFDEVIKSSQDFINSMANTDPMFKYGASLLQLSDSFAQLAGSPEDASKAFINILEDVKKLGQFSGATATRLGSMREEFLKNASAAKANANALKEAKDNLAKYNTEENAARVDRFKKEGYNEEEIVKISTEDTGKYLKALSNLNEVERRVKQANTDFVTIFARASAEIRVGLQESFIKGANLIEKSLGMATARAGIEISKAASIGLTGSRATEQSLALIKQEVGLRMEEISLREREIFNLAELNNTLQLVDARAAFRANAATAGPEAAAKAPELKQAVTILEGLSKAFAGGTKGVNEAYAKGRVGMAMPRTQAEEDEQTVTRKIAQGVSGVKVQTSGLEAQKIAENTKIVTAEIAAQYKLNTDNSEAKQRELKATIDTYTEEANRLSILDSISGSLDVEITKKKILAQNTAEAAKQTSDNLALEDTYRAQVQLSQNKKLSADARAYQLKESEVTLEKLSAQMVSQSDKDATKGLADQQNVLQKNLGTSKRDYEVLTAKNTLQNTVLNTEQQISEARYNAYAALGNLTEVEKTNATYNIELAKSNLTLQTATNEKIVQATELEKTRNLEKALMTGVDAVNFQLETDRQVGLINSSIAGLNVEASARNTILGIVKESSLYLGKQADDMTRMKDITSELAAIFGTLGDSIGKTGEALLKMSQDDESYAKQKLVIQEKINAVVESGDDPSSALLKEKIDLDKKAAKAEMANIGAVAGASKKMFAEKTLAYKVLSGVEKAASLYKLAMQVKELATEGSIAIAKIFSSQVGVAGAVAEGAAESAALGPKLAGASGKLVADSGWLGFAGIAALLAIVASFGGDTGGATIPAGISAADIQEVQGTGQTWSNGQKVDTGGGVFGDNTAKNEVIVKSLEILKDNSIEGIVYDNKMLKALEKIALSVTDVASSVYQIPGIRAGSAFGTAEGTSGGSFLGWGSSTSTSIQDAGVVISGVFTDLADASKNAVRQYETVLRVTSSSSWFGLSKSSSSSIDTTEKLLEDPKLKQAFADIFTNAIGLFTEIGKSAGITEDTIKQTLKTIPITLTTSLKGLTGPEMEAALNSTVGKALSVASETLFSGMFEQFKKFGEDYLTTVIRIVDSSNKVKLAFGSLAIGMNTIGIDAYEVSNGLVEASGGLSNFLESIQLMSDMFMTEAERLKTTTASVTITLASLSASSRKTEVVYGAKPYSEQLPGTLTAPGETTNPKWEQWMQAFWDEHMAKYGQSWYNASSEEIAAQYKYFADIYVAENVAPKIGTSSTETNQFAIDLFREISDNKDSIIDTKEEYYKLITAAKSAADVAVAAEDAIGLARRTEAINLYASLTSPTLLNAQKAIWEAAKTYADAQADQNVTIYGLLGNAEEALLITRQKELASLDPRLVAGREYIFALQDEASIKAKLKTAYEKQNTVLTTTVNNLTNFIKSITAARDALILGAQSTLTPTEKYAEAKSQVAALKAVIATTGMDDASVLARNDALSKLPSVTGTFLDASKVLYASSEQYTQDFNSVLTLLDNTAASLATQQSDAERQLTELKASTGYLDSIDTTADSIESLLAQLLVAQGVTAAAKIAAAAAGTTAAGTAPVAAPSANQVGIEGFYQQYLHRSANAADMAYQLANIDTGTSLAGIGENIRNSLEAKTQLLYEKLAGRVGELGGVQYWMDQAAVMSKSDLIGNFANSVVANREPNATELARQIASGVISPAVPGYAKGGLAHGLAMVGERGPELVDFATPSRVYSNKASNDMLNNQELLAEIRRLNATVDKLVADQNKQTGHLIESNFAANAEAAQKVVDATLEAASNSTWKERSAIKIA